MGAKKKVPRRVEAGRVISNSAASKVASVVVHAAEWLETQEPLDLEALRASLADPEVAAWVEGLGALAPLRRKLCGNVHDCVRGDVVSCARSPGHPGSHQSLDRRNW